MNRLNRRSFLALIPALAAAAPLAAVAAQPAQAAALKAAHDESVRLASEIDAAYERRAAIWAAGGCSYTPDCPCGDDLPAWTRDPESVKRVLYGGLPDAIAQARADGYNRGREVESARQEARQVTAYHWGNTVWTRLGLQLPEDGS